MQIYQFPVINARERDPYLKTRVNTVEELSLRARRSDPP